MLLFSPIEISYPVTEDQAFLIVAGFVVSVAVKSARPPPRVAPLSRLTDTMRSVEPLEPGRRLVIPARADAEVEALTTAFNEMLDRLEDERRESGRRALDAQEQERQRIAARAARRGGPGADASCSCSSRRPGRPSTNASRREAVRHSLEECAGSRASCAPRPSTSSGSRARSASSAPRRPHTTACASSGASISATRS